MNSEIGLLINKLCRSGDAEELSRVLRLERDNIVSVSDALHGESSAECAQKFEMDNDDSSRITSSPHNRSIAFQNILRRDFLVACKHGHGNCVKSILDIAISIGHDAIMDLFEFKDLKTGKSGLHLASGVGSVEVVFILITYFNNLSRDVEANCDESSGCAAKRAKQFSIFETLDNSGYSPLELAVLSNRSSVVQLLLRFNSSTLDKEKLLALEPDMPRKSPQVYSIICNYNYPEWDDYKFDGNGLLIPEDENMPLSGAKNRTIRHANLYLSDNNLLKTFANDNGPCALKVVLKCSKSIKDIEQELRFHMNVVRDEDRCFARLVFADVLKFEFVNNRLVTSKYHCKDEVISSRGLFWYGLILERGEIDLHKVCTSLSQGNKSNSDILKNIKNGKPKNTAFVSSNISVSWKLVVAEEMLRIVCMLHERNFCWMDVKLSNFVVFNATTGFEIKAIDLGGCLKICTAVKYEEISFSMKFAAPELIRLASCAGTSDCCSSSTETKYVVSDKSDLWSLGMCLLQLEHRHCQVFYQSELNLNHSSEIMQYFASNSDLSIQTRIDDYIFKAMESNPSKLLVLAKSFLQIDPSKRASIKAAIENLDNV